MEVETICRYNLPVCVVVFNNDGIYRGDGVNLGGGADPATTMFVPGARYDKMIEGFGGIGVNVTTPDDLKRAVDARDGLRQAHVDQRGDRSGGGQQVAISVTSIRKARSIPARTGEERTA